MIFTNRQEAMRVYVRLVITVIPYYNIRCHVKESNCQEYNVPTANRS